MRSHALVPKCKKTYISPLPPANGPLASWLPSGMGLEGIILFMPHPVRLRREEVMSPMARWHWDEWIWTVRNGVAALAAILLAAILSQALVFQEAALGPDGINAAAVVRLLGYGIALALIWTTAWRAAAQIPPLDAVS